MTSDSTLLAYCAILAFLSLQENNIGGLMFGNINSPLFLIFKYHEILYYKVLCGYLLIIWFLTVLKKGPEKSKQANIFTTTQTRSGWEGRVGGWRRGGGRRSDLIHVQAV
jgi:hypothetical protein